LIDAENDNAARVIARSEEATIATEGEAGDCVVGFELREWDVVTEGAEQLPLAHSGWRTF
jgi:hypothetical protein